MSEGAEKSNPSMGRSVWKLLFKVSLDLRLPSSIMEKQGWKDGTEYFIHWAFEDTEYLPIYNLDCRIKYSNISTVMTIGRIKDKSDKAANEKFSF